MFFIKHIVKNNKKWAIFGLFFCVLVIAVIFSNFATAEIISPSVEPPNNNPSGFLQIGDMTQGKSGSLRLGTSDVASKFNYQLEVLGEGADVSNVVIDNDLLVSDTTTSTNTTLYVDSTNNKVCLGSCLDVSDSKLDVSDNGIIINNTAGIGRGLSVYSSNNEAIFSRGALGGIQSVSSGSNSSIQAVSTTGAALKGTNISHSYSSVLGYSDKGIGVYGTNINFLGLWSGYFDGRLESNTDVSGSKFLSANQFNSLVPHTVGQNVGSFNLGNAKILLHDGTNIWLARDNKIIKARGSDGFQLFEITVGNNPSSVIYDGEFIWIVYEDGVLKIDSANGSTECSIALDDPRSIIFTGDNYWVTVNGTGELVNLDDGCVQIGSAVSLVNYINYSLGEIIYNGSYLWVLATNDTTGAGSMININPSSKEAFRWDGLIGINPVDIVYDNYYYWVLNSEDGTVTRFYLQNDKVCSLLNYESNPESCYSNSYCGGLGLGTCIFAIPQQYGVYLVSTHSSDTPVAMMQDSQNIWIINQWVDSGSNYAELIRMPMAEPSSPESFSLNMTPTNIAFDETNLWISSSDGGLVNMYSGSGFGKDDLSDTVALQNNNPLISQSGNFSIDGIGNFQGDAVGEGNIISTNNIWGEEGLGDIIVGNQGDPNVPLPEGNHNCPNGHFVTFVSENSSGQINRIECKPL